MPAGLGLLELEPRPPRDHVETMVDVALEIVLEIEDLRTPANDRQHDRAEGGLQGRMLVEVIEDHLAHRALLDLHHDADVVLRLVADVGDALDHLVLHEIRHVLDHVGLVDGIGNLGDDDALAAALLDLDLGLAADGELALPELVHRVDAVVAADRRAGREVRTLHELHQVVDRALLAVLHVVVDAVAELPEVVRRNVRRHADGNARGAVEEEVRKLRRQDRRLLQGLVVVRDEVDRVLLEIAQELVGDALHADFGVTHRRSAVAVDGAEVAVAVHQRHAQRERLGHADDRVVDGRIAVRMVLADHFAHHAGRLHVLRVPLVVKLVHREETAAVDGLQTVTDIR